MLHWRIAFLKGAAAISAIPALMVAFSGGPPARNTGAPGDQTCARAGCHVGTLNPDSQGQLTVSFPSGQRYTPGVKQRLRVTLAHPSAQRWGFQLTARLESDEANGQAGTFTPADGSMFVNCADDTPRRGPACPAAAPLEFIEHSEGGTRRGTSGSSSWEFDWTPPGSPSGSIVLYVAGNAANGDGFPTGDRIYTAKFTVTGPAPPPAQPKPVIAQNGVVNGASFQPALSQNSWLTIQGSNLAQSARTLRDNEISGGRFPTEIDGVRVTLNGRPAAMFYVSPTQINAITPTDASEGPVQVQVVNANGASDPVTVQLQRFAPALFLFQSGKYAAATHADGSLVGPRALFPGASTPASPGEVIILYGTGFGLTTPPFSAGQLVDKLTQLNDGLTIRIGGTMAEVQFAGLAPGFAGLYQFNVRVPDSAANGDNPVIAEIGGVSSPTGTLITVEK